MSEHALIVGATSGIARALAAELAGRGWSLTLTARDDAEAEAIEHDLRVRFGSPVDRLHLQVDADVDFGRVFEGQAYTAVAVCHGAYVPQDVAVADTEAHRRMIESNYTATVLLLEAAARHFEARKQGRIIVLSSVAGERGRASNYPYGATKAALTAYLSGLRARLDRSGVHVMTVKPGPVDTKMLKEANLSGRAADPARVARDIARGIAHRTDVLYTPGYWRCVMGVIRMLPEFIFKRIRF